MPPKIQFMKMEKTFKTKIKKIKTEIEAQKLYGYEKLSSLDYGQSGA